MLDWRAQGARPRECNGQRDAQRRAARTLVERDGSDARPSMLWTVVDCLRGTTSGARGAVFLPLAIVFEIESFERETEVSAQSRVRAEAIGECGVGCELPVSPVGAASSASAHQPRRSRTPSRQVERVEEGSQRRHVLWRGAALDASTADVAKGGRRTFHARLGVRLLLDFVDQPRVVLGLPGGHEVALQLLEK